LSIDVRRTDVGSEKRGVGLELGNRCLRDVVARGAGCVTLKRPPGKHADWQADGHTPWPAGRCSIIGSPFRKVSSRPTSYR